jgi:hypothetical protein
VAHEGTAGGSKTRREPAAAIALITLLLYPLVFGSALDRLSRISCLLVFILTALAFYLKGKLTRDSIYRQEVAAFKCFESKFKENNDKITSDCDGSK